jgi:hypothetical protein
MPIKVVDTQSIADRIKILMRALGFDNERKMAVAMGYERPDNIYNATKGERMPGIPLLIDLSNTFENANIGWILTGRGEMLFAGKKKSSIEKMPDPLLTLFAQEIQNMQSSLNKLSKAIPGISDSLPGPRPPVEDLQLGKRPGDKNPQRKNDTKGSVSKKGN